MEKELKKLALIFCGILICFTILITTNNRTKDTFNVLNENTGVVLREKISCLPKDNLTKELYKENGISLNGLPDCKNYSITGPVTSKEGLKKDSGIFNLILVRPLAFILIKIANIFNNYLIAFLFLILIKSIFTFRNNYKMAINNKNMKKVNEQIASISNKYHKESDYWTKERPYDETLARIAYADDLKALYATNNIKPMAGCLTSLVQLPILIAFLTIIYTIPAILETKLFGLSLGASPKVLFEISPIITTIAVILLMFTTFMNAIITTDKLININKNSIITAIIVTILILSITFSLPFGVIIYFVISDIFNIIGKILINKRLSK